MVRVRAAVVFILVPAAAVATTYAVVAGHEVTQADVKAAVGYVPSGADELAGIVEGLVERKIILGLAERNGITCAESELRRTLAFIAKTLGVNNALPDDDYRRYVREEIIIGKYIDAYVYPRVNVSDEQLERLFLLVPGDFLRPVPATRTRLKEIFPLYRNEVYNRYVKLEVARLLREDVEGVKKFIEIKYYINVNGK